MAKAKADKAETQAQTHDTFANIATEFLAKRRAEGLAVTTMRHKEGYKLCHCGLIKGDLEL